jgi:hypothetical protein
LDRPSGGDGQALVPNGHGTNDHNGHGPTGVNGNGRPVDGLANGLATEGGPRGTRVREDDPLGRNNGSAHNGSAHNGSAHNGSAHNGSAHNGSLHNGAGHDGPGAASAAGASAGLVSRADAPRSEPSTKDAAETNGHTGPDAGPSERERTDADRTAIPAPRVSSAETAGPNTGNSGLRRRVPQANLAPELKAGTTPVGSAPAPARPAGPSTDAAQALSRYQASRQAAQAVADQHEPLDDRRTHQ